MKFTSKQMANLPGEVGHGALIQFLADIFERLEALENPTDRPVELEKASPLFSKKLGDLELRQWDARQRLEIVFWHCPARNHPLNTSPDVYPNNPFCFTIASWAGDQNGPLIEFCGNRPIEYVVTDEDREAFWELAEMGQQMAEKAFREKETG